MRRGNAAAGADAIRPAGIHRSALDLFSIGIGPSSSHTVGPMRAANDFGRRVADAGGAARVRVRLLGSLGATGIGHGTPDAVVAGPRRASSPRRATRPPCAGSWQALGADGVVRIGGVDVAMGMGDVELAPLTRLPRHPNAMRCTALDAERRRARRGDLLLGGRRLRRARGRHAGRHPGGRVPRSRTSAAPSCSRSAPRPGTTSPASPSATSARCGPRPRCSRGSTRSGRRWPAASARASRPRACCRAACTCRGGRPRSPRSWTRRDPARGTRPTGSTPTRSR